MTDDDAIVDEALSYGDVVTEAWRRGNLQYQLKPTQLELHAWMQGQKEMVSVIHARRGYGKSWLFLTDAFEQCIQLANEGTSARILYAATTREDAKQIVIPTGQLIVQQALRDGVPKNKLPVWYASDHAFIFPEAEGRVIIEGADDDQGDHLRGPFAHRAYFDEAGFWRYLNYCLTSVVIPIVKRRNGKIFVASTSPKSVGHEFTALISKSMLRGAYVRKTIDDDTTLTKAEVDGYALEYGETVEEGRKATAFRREYMCELVTDSTRAVIPEYTDERHIGTLERPDWVDCYVGLDLGLVDLTHALFGFWHFTEAKLVIEDELVGQYMRTVEFAEKAKAKEEQLWGTIPYFGRKDGTNRCPWGRYSDNEAQQLYDLAGMGLSFAPAMKTDKEAAINRLRQMFAAGKVLINPRCTQLLHQLRVGIWNERRSDYERMPGAGHLDGIDALVYLARMIDYSRNPMPGMIGVARQTHHFTANEKRATHPMAGILRRR